MALGISGKKTQGINQRMCRDLTEIVDHFYAYRNAHMQTHTHTGKWYNKAKMVIHLFLYTPFADLNLLYMSGSILQWPSSGGAWGECPPVSSKGWGMRMMLFTLCAPHLLSAWAPTQWQWGLGKSGEWIRPSTHLRPEAWAGRVHGALPGARVCTPALRCKPELSPSTTLVGTTAIIEKGVMSKESQNSHPSQFYMILF